MLCIVARQSAVKICLVIVFLFCHSCPRMMMITATAADAAVRPSRTAVQTVRMAVLLPGTAVNGTRWVCSLERVSSVIAIAMEAVNDDPSMSAFKLTVRYADDRCDNAEAVNHAIRFFMDGQVDVFVGPICDYAAAPVARQARFWNLPVITAGAMARGFTISHDHRRKVYSVLTRVGNNFNSLAAFTVRLLRTYGWTRVKLVYEPKGQDDIVEDCCHLATSGIHEVLMAANGIKHDYFKITKERAFKKEELIEEIGKKYASK